MLRQALFRLSQQRHLRTVATHNRLARGMALRFVAGETLESALDVVRQAQARGMTSTLDHLGENVTSRAAAVDAAAACRAALDALDAANLERNISIKLTQLGLDLDPVLARNNAETLLHRAAEIGGFVRIDMEGSPYTTRTLGIFFDLYARYKDVGTVIQSALYRSQADTKRLLEAGAHVRLVKGAYLEPPEIAYRRKVDVDANYVQLARMLLRGDGYPAFATHDPAMIDAVRRMAVEEGRYRSRFEFQMLYGVRRDLQDSLVQEGFRVRIYIPYGTEWYPYFMRRLAERPANVAFVAGSILREMRAGRR